MEGWGLGGWGQQPEEFGGVTKHSAEQIMALNMLYGKKKEKRRVWGSQVRESEAACYLHIQRLMQDLRSLFRLFIYLLVCPVSCSTLSVWHSVGGIRETEKWHFPKPPRALR